MDKEEFGKKYATYLLEEHVDYVSSEFAELLIPTMREVLKKHAEQDPKSARLRVLIADQLYRDFSPEQFDQVADFADYPGPGGQSLNAWVKSLQLSTVEGEALQLERPFSWWGIYLGVSQAFSSRPVMRWVARQQSTSKATIGEIVVKVVLQKAIRQRYRESAAEAYKIVCGEYARWHDDDSNFDASLSQTKLHRIVFDQLDKGTRDAELFANEVAELSSPSEP